MQLEVMMKNKWIVLTVIIVIIVSNLPIVSTVLMDKIDRNHFKYANADASFTIIQPFDILRPWMNEDVVWRFNENQRPRAENREIFRLYQINPLCFWRWRYYLLVSISFRYKSWKDIEPNRTPLVPDNMWQQF